MMTTRSQFHAVHRLMRQHFGPPPSVKSSHPLALHEGEGGGGAGGTGGGAAGGGGTGGGEKTFTQAELDAAVKGLKDKNAELLGLNKSLKTRADVIGDRTPEDVQADLDFAKKAREERQRAAGEFDAMKTDLVGKHQQAIGLKDKRISHLEDKLFDVHARREVSSEISRQGGSAVMLEPHVLKFVQVKEDDSGSFVTTVVDAKGNPRFGDAKGTPMTIEQLVTEFKANADYGAAFKAPSAAGSGSPGGTPSVTTTGAGGDMVISRADGQDVAKYRAAKAEAEKRGVKLVIGT